MRKALYGALTGFCLGAVLGYVSYCVAYEEGIYFSRLITYSPFVPTSPSGSVSLGENRWFSAYGLVGIVHGGGLAAIAGAIIGGVGAIVGAIRENRRLALLLERQQTVPEKEHHA
jgi:hypothetical protein